MQKKYHRLAIKKMEGCYFHKPRHKTLNPYLIYLSCGYDDTEEVWIKGVPVSPGMSVIECEHRIMDGHVWYPKNASIIERRKD